MSHHHENVIWQSADGTWSRGFFQRERSFGSHNEDDDPEWDDDYDYDTFEWVSAGHRTASEAAAAWHGSNPGGHNEYSYRPGDPDSVGRIDRFDDMAAVLYEAEAARGFDLWGWNRYNGTPKHRKTAAVQATRDSVIEGWVSSRARGYDNSFDPFEQLPKLNTDLAARYSTATPEERAAFDERDTAHRTKLRDLLAKARADWVEDNRRNSRYSFSSYDHGQAQKRSDCFAEVEKFIDKLDASAAGRAATAKPTAVPAPTTITRAKTTDKSTAGSFAPRQLAEADTSILA